jgi:hypothetical protein
MRIASGSMPAMAANPPEATVSPSFATVRK